MVLVLCIGDMHIPHRVADLPPKFRSLLVPGKIQHVLCTGDVCVKETYDYLRSLCADVHAVRGNYDGDFAAGWPDAKTVKIGDFKFGLTHGHRVVPHGDVNALAAAQRAMNVDVLVSGTCRRWGAHKVEDRLIVNPGSLRLPQEPVRGRPRGAGQLRRGLRRGMARRQDGEDRRL